MRDTFPDRRAELFGREPDIHFLCDRARAAGLTVVAARPLMGKTWTLAETARRLEEEGTFIVGYHESKGAESSHLLYAVSNLYTRWLEDSRMWDQARSLWERHKDGLVPRIGQAVGAIFEKLGGKLLPEGVAAVVQKAFDGLAQAQDDLLEGGLRLTPLPYDEALALTNLVTTLSEKRVVLILDAWEKSPSIPREFATLESFAKNPQAWPGAHLMLAVRNPEVDSTKLNDEALRRARDLCKVSSAATVYELPAIDRPDAKEQARLVDFVRAQLPAAKDTSDARLVDMIAGYPGVLGFWLNETTCRAMRTPNDLSAQAGNAQALRYIELDHLLGQLTEPELSLAARLTVFPRLDAAGWANFSTTLLADGPDDPFYALVDAGILVDEPFPTFGHDTRYVAARRWFVEHQKPLVRRLATRMMDRIASAIDGVVPRHRPRFEALVGFAATIPALDLDTTVRCLIAAARSVIEEPTGLFDGDFHADALAACRRTPGVAPLLAIAINNRAIENARRGAPDAERADYDAVIALPNALPDDVGRALSNRAIGKTEAGDPAGALADFDAAVALSGLTPGPLATILFNRGLLRGQLGDTAGELADCTRIVEMPQASAEHVARALVSRGVTRREIGDQAGAIADNTAVIALAGAPIDRVSTALRHRSLLYKEQGDDANALADCTTLIELPGATEAKVVAARLDRGVARARAGRLDDAVADFSAVLALAAARPDDIALAHLNRASTWKLARRLDDAERDLRAAAAVPGVSGELLSAAHGELGRLRGAPPSPVTRAPDIP